MGDYVPTEMHRLKHTILCGGVEVSLWGTKAGFLILVHDPDGHLMSVSGRNIRHQADKTFDAQVIVNGGDING